MPHQGAPMGPPGPPYGASPAVRPGLPAPVIEASRKRPAPSQQVQQQAVQNRTRKYVPDSYALFPHFSLSCLLLRLIFIHVCDASGVA